MVLLRRIGSVVASLGGAAVLFAGCGGSGGSGKGGVTLNWWAYNEPSGSFTKAAERCNKLANGRYTIAFNALGKDPDTQRQQLVRRLAAQDSSIDMMSMDVVWTGEFAQAGWVRPWPAPLAAQIRQGTLAAPLATATYQGKLYAAPANSNTQLLWYRKDLVKTPPKTWDELITAAEKMPKNGTIEEQGAAYEGLTVWFNSLVQSAGGAILQSNGQPALGPPAKRAAAIISRLANSKAADPALSTTKEDSARLAFEKGTAAFQVNYPFIYPSAKMNAPKLYKEIGWAPFPQVDANKPSKAPVGGFNWGVSAFTKHPDEAFAAATCLRDEGSQKLFATLGGLPPTLSAPYDDKKFTATYPFAGLIRKQLQNGAVRPLTPAYSDVSLAIYTTLYPPKGIKPDSVVKSLTDTIKKSLDSGALL